MEFCALRSPVRGCDRPARGRAAMSIVLLVFAAALARPAMAEILPAFIDLLRQAESSAPRLIEVAANVQAAQGLAQQAAAFPNPQLSVQSENFDGSRSFDRLSPVQNTVSLSEVLEVGGKRHSRIAAGQADLEAARVAYLQSKSDFAHDLAIAYAAAEAAQARADLAAEELMRAQEDLRIARALVESGRESELRALQAQAAVANARADMEAARASAVEALIRVSTLVGVPEPYTGIGPSLLKLAPTLKVPSLDPSQTAPAIVAARAEREAAARRVDVERKRAISDVTVSVGSRRLAGEDANALVAGVSVALPIFDRNRGAVAARLAELSAADARLNAARLEADANWRVAVSQARAADNRLRASEETESTAQEAYRLSRIGYDAGRTPLIELLATRRVLIDAQLRSLDARFARIQAEATLARLTGRIPFGE
jgi:cobalt-zinc-cadmium efflux system outer membrane protein